MRKRVASRVLRPWLILLAGLGALLAGAAPAMATVLDPIPIQPNQAFVGVVNGSSGEARINVRCFAPTGVVPTTGHPVAGQKVSVTRVFTAAPDRPVGTPVSGLGFTGSAGRAVGVGFGPTDATKPPVLLRGYELGAEIPTDLVVPCGGTGAVTFNPLPTSPTARPAVVKVTFVRVL
jgi:hypothetical protein